MQLASAVLEASIKDLRQIGNGTGQLGIRISRLPAVSSAEIFREASAVYGQFIVS
jgi:hypothetical protein